jgi:hypothetical protein
MNSLIVDFPSQQEVLLTTTRLMKFIPHPTAKEVKDCWYLMARDSIHCSIILFCKSELGVGLSGDEQARCVGLEHLLSRGVNQNILLLNKAQKQHVRKVLNEQDCQMRLAIEVLGLVSVTKSFRSRARAYLIAAA